MNEKIEDGWFIPSHLSYESYQKLVGALYQKKADVEKVSTVEFAKAAGVIPKNAYGVVRFLLSLNIITGDKSSGYNLTPDGLIYAKAVYGSDNESIKKIFPQIIEKTHINSLVDYIAVNKNSLTLDGLHNFIKQEGRFPEGNGPTGMSAPYATGSKTLLQIFKSAELLSAELELETKPSGGRKLGDKTKITSRRKHRDDSPRKTHDKESWFNYQTENFTMSMNKNIDEDSFEFIESQINSTLQFWKKKIGSDENSDLESE